MIRNVMRCPKRLDRSCIHELVTGIRHVGHGFTGHMPALTDHKYKYYGFSDTYLTVIYFGYISHCRKNWQFVKTSLSQQ